MTAAEPVHCSACQSMQVPKQHDKCKATASERRLKEFSMQQIQCTAVDPDCYRKNTVYFPCRCSARLSASSCQVLHTAVEFVQLNVRACKCQYSMTSATQMLQKENWRNFHCSRTSASSCQVLLQQDECTKNTNTPRKVHCSKNECNAVWEAGNDFPTLPPYVFTTSFSITIMMWNV